MQTVNDALEKLGKSNAEELVEHLEDGKMIIAIMMNVKRPLRSVTLLMGK